VTARRHYEVPLPLLVTITVVLVLAYAAGMALLIGGLS